MIKNANRDTQSKALNYIRFFSPDATLLSHFVNLKDIPDLKPAVPDLGLPFDSRFLYYAGKHEKDSRLSRPGN